MQAIVLDKNLGYGSILDTISDTFLDTTQYFGYAMFWDTFGYLYRLVQASCAHELGSIRTCRCREEVQDDETPTPLNGRFSWALRHCAMLTA